MPNTTKAPAAMGGTGDINNPTDLKNHHAHSANNTSKINTMGTPGRVNTCRSFMGWLHRLRVISTTPYHD
jgi:hypothetical protein